MQHQDLRRWQIHPPRTAPRSCSSASSGPTPASTGRTVAPIAARPGVRHQLVVTELGRAVLEDGR